MTETRHLRRPGLIGGLVLLTLGITILLRNLGWIDDFWGFVSQYWPLMLILMGAAKIVEYLLGTSGRILRFSEFALIILVILFGLLASRLPFRFRLPLGGRQVSVRDYYGTSFTFTEEKTQTVPSDPFILIRNTQGSVVLVSGVEGQLRIKLRKIVYARSEQQARSMASQIRLAVSRESAGWRVEAEILPEFKKELRFESFFEISVPPRLRTDIQNNNGDVSLEGLTGNQKVATSYGRLSLMRLQGNIEASNKYGETRASGITGDVHLNCLHSKTTVENVSGDLTVSNSYSPVEVSDIRGKTSIGTSYASVSGNNLKQQADISAPGSTIDLDGVDGEVKLRSSHKEVSLENCTHGVDVELEYGSLRANNIGGDLVARTTYSSLSGSRIKGMVKIDSVGTTVDLEDVRGETNVRTNYKSVTIVDFYSKIAVTNENGDIFLSASASPKQPVTATTTYGKVELSLPDNSAFQLEAQTRSGDVGAEFSALQTVSAPEDVRFLRGQIGAGGPLIKLVSSYNNVFVKKLSR